MATLQSIGTYAAPGRGPVGLAGNGRFLFNADFAAKEIYQLDPATGETVGILTSPGNISGLAWDGQHLWQSRLDEGVLCAINPDTNDFDRTIAVEEHGWLSGVAWDGQHLWAVSQQRGCIFALDHDSGDVVGTIPAPVAGGDLDFYNGSLWLGIAYPMRFDERFEQFEWEEETRHFALLRLDPTDGREIARYPLDFLPMGVAWVGENVWLSHTRERKLYRMQLM